ncbi:MAG: hypothetical protein RLZZ165_1923, partial [Bacteroidota bacterium]
MAIFLHIREMRSAFSKFPPLMDALPKSVDLVVAVAWMHPR